MSSFVHRVIRRCCFAAGLIAAAAGHPGSTVHADWPRFLGPQIDGSVHDTPTLQAVAATDWTAKPRLVWSLDVGEGYGIGTLRDGRYYQFDAVTDAPAVPARFRPASQSERLRCIELSSGEVLWSHATPLDYRDMYGYEAGPRSSPTIDRDQIFTFGVRGRLTCRDLKTGQAQWSAQTSDDFGVVQNFFGVASAPLVLGDAVIVMVGGSPPADQDVAPGRLDRLSPDGTGLVAFDRRSGKVKWKCVDDLASYSSPRPVVIDGTTCVLCFARDHLWCVDAERGEVLWKVRHRADLLESVNAMTPVVSDQRVFVSECYGVGSVLLDVSGDEPKEIWKDPPLDRRNMAMRSHWATPVLKDGFLYGGSGRNSPDSDLRCIDLSSGRVRWTALERRRCSVTLAGDKLLVMEERGDLHIAEADPEKWSPLASHDLADADSMAGNADESRLTYPCWSAPVVSGDKVLVRGDRRVICLSFPPKN